MAFRGKSYALRAHLVSLKLLLAGKTKEGKRLLKSGGKTYPEFPVFRKLQVPWDRRVLARQPLASSPETRLWPWLMTNSRLLAAPLGKVQLLVVNGNPMSWQKVKVLTSLGKMHQRIEGPPGLPRRAEVPQQVLHLGAVAPMPRVAPGAHLAVAALEQREAAGPAVGRQARALRQEEDHPAIPEASELDIWERAWGRCVFVFFFFAPLFFACFCVPPALFSGPRCKQ